MGNDPLNSRSLPSSTSTPPGSVQGRSSTSSSGWYSYGVSNKVAYFDGTVWTGATAYTRLPVLTRSKPIPDDGTWIWCLIVGQVLCVASALLAKSTGINALAWTSIVGFTVFMAGTFLLVDSRVDLRSLPGFRRLVGYGVIAGLVAVALTFPIEAVLLHTMGTRSALWLTGPIEETAKLAFPVALLAWGGRRFRTPKAGLLLVLVSSATFGVLEGTKWESDTTDVWLHLQLALARPGAELFHPLLTGFAACVIWIAAWRAHRLLTKPGVLAYLLVVAIHSLHDGIAGLLLPSGQKQLIEPVHSASLAITIGVGGWVLLGIQAVLLFRLLRYAARELVTPDLVGASDAKWLPRLKTWGLPNGVPPAAPPPTTVIADGPRTERSSPEG